MSLIAAVIALSVLFNGQDNTAYAASAQEDVQSDLENEISRSIEQLIGGDFEDFFNALDENGKGIFGKSAQEIAMKLAKGESVTAEVVVQVVSQSFATELTATFSALIGIVMLAFLSSIAKNVSSGFQKESTAKLIHFVIYGSIISIIAALLTSAVVSARAIVILAVRLTEIALPIMLTLLAAIGGGATSGVFQPIAAFLTGFIAKTIEVVVIPMFIASSVFIIVSNLTKGVKFTKLAEGLQSVAKWLMGILFGILITLLTLGGTVGAGVDGVSLKSMKFAVSGYVPILGGYLASGFDIVLAGALVVKNSVGALAVLLLFAAVCAPILKLVVLSLLLKLAGGIVQATGEDEISSLLTGTGKNLNILIAGSAGVAFCAGIFFTMFIFIFNGGVL
ncbi:MAG: stage III sporulation protein AE [Christensenellaceae bacterium]|nr:stage III sporulation protein AE [Christensenellaceae bacterium]